MTLQICQHTTIISQNLNFYSVLPLPAEPLTFLPKMSNYQHRAVYFSLVMPHRNVLITFNHFYQPTNALNYTNLEDKISVV